MRNRSLWLALFASLMLSACIDFGGDDGDGAGGGGGGGGIGADETPEVALPGSGGGFQDGPCEGVVGSLVPESCTPLKTELLCPIALQATEAGINAIEGAVQLLFGACREVVPPVERLKVYIESFPREADPPALSNARRNRVPNVAGTGFSVVNEPRTSADAPIQMVFFITVEGSHAGAIEVDLAAGLTGREQDLVNLKANLDQDGAEPKDTANADYVIPQGQPTTLVFVPNPDNTKVTQQFVVNILGDNLCEDENNEGVGVRITKVRPAMTSDGADGMGPRLIRKSGIGYIIDDVREGENCFTRERLELACGQAGASQIQSGVNGVGFQNPRQYSTGKTLRAVSNSYAYMARGPIAALLGVMEGDPQNLHDYHYRRQNQLPLTEDVDVSVDPQVLRGTLAAGGNGDGRDGKILNEGSYGALLGGNNMGLVAGVFGNTAGPRLAPVPLPPGPLPLLPLTLRPNAHAISTVTQFGIDRTLTIETGVAIAEVIGLTAPGAVETFDFVNAVAIEPEDADFTQATVSFDPLGSNAEAVGLTASAFLAGVTMGQVPDSEPLLGPIPPNTVISLITEDGEIGTIVLNEQIHGPNSAQEDQIGKNVGQIRFNKRSQRGEYAWQIVNLAHANFADGSELIIGHNFAGVSCQDESPENDGFVPFPEAVPQVTTPPRGDMLVNLPAGVPGVPGGPGDLPAPVGAAENPICDALGIGADCSGMPAPPNEIPTCAPDGSPPPLAGECLPLP